MQFEKIKLVIDKWDPLRLLASEAPPDEYDLESRAIFQAANTITSPEELAVLIQQVFIRFFGESISPSYDSCLLAAQKILDN
ncbi:DUF1871 family protein [Brevibacillus fluminis]|uniref:DUF1871 family protein n=1 Tax=Brevibacillus fluminis TaxID=511487 RepID=UPI003F8B17D1